MTQRERAEPLTPLADSLFCKVKPKAPPNHRRSTWLRSSSLRPQSSPTHSRASWRSEDWFAGRVFGCAGRNTRVYLFCLG